MAQNEILRNRATSKPTQIPTGFKLFLMDEKTLTSVRLSHVVHQEELPRDDDQYFDFRTGEGYTVWMHAHGDFLCWGCKTPDAGEREEGELLLEGELPLLLQGEGEVLRMRKIWVWMDPRGLVRPDPRGSSQGSGQTPGVWSDQTPGVWMDPRGLE